MTNRDNGGAAFPGVEVTTYASGNTSETHHPGMTLRQWYAGMALQGLADGVERRDGIEPLAKWCFEIADAMIREGQK